MGKLDSDGCPNGILESEQKKAERRQLLEEERIRKQQKKEEHQLQKQLNQAEYPRKPVRENTQSEIKKKKKSEELEDPFPINNLDQRYSFPFHWPAVCTASQGKVNNFQSMIRILPLRHSGQSDTKSQTLSAMAQ